MAPSMGGAGTAHSQLRLHPSAGQGANPKAPLRSCKPAGVFAQGFIPYPGWATPSSTPGDAPWLLLPAGMGLPMGCSRLCGCSVELKRDFGFSASWSWDVSSPKALPGKASAPQPASSLTAPQEMRSQNTNSGRSPRVGERSWWVLFSQGKDG